MGFKGGKDLLITNRDWLALDIADAHNVYESWICYPQSQPDLLVVARFQRVGSHSINVVRVSYPK